MQDQILHWIPLTLALAVSILILLWSRPARKERRSCGQRIILLLYKTARWSWALARAVDIGYLEYCRVISDAVFEIENEKAFGNRIKPIGKTKLAAEGLRRWEAAQKSA